MTDWLPHVESISRFIVAIMLNSIWEDAILVFAVWLLLHFLRNTNASTRYFSWLVTMVAAVSLPILTTLPQTTFVGAPRQAVSSNVSTATAVGPVHHSVQQRKTAPPQTRLPAQTSSLRAPERLRLLFPSWLATVLFGVWILSALIIGVRLTIDLLSLERLKRDSLPLPVEFRDQMERWVKAAHGNAREVRICVSKRIEVPVAVGLFDSMILLPQRLLQELSAGELDRISLHELAHLHRGDDWTNSVQRFAQTLLFFNPAVRFVGAHLDLEREVACDDWVLSLTGDVRPYASCLTRMAELTSWPHRPLAAPGVFVTRKGISIRIERLLNKHRNARVDIAYGVPGVVALALAGFFALANVVTPEIAYTSESASSTVAKASHGIAIVTYLRKKQMAPPGLPPVPVLAKSTPNVPPLTARKVVLPPKNQKGRAALPVPIRPHMFGQLAPIAHVPHLPQAPVGVGSIEVPEINVNIPEQNIAVHVPAVHVHVPGQHINIPQTVGANNGGFSCTGCSFKGVNWSGKDLSGHSFTGAEFTNANLEGTNFSYAYLSGVDFRGANLRNANFTGAEMSGCDLKGANIAGAKFDRAHISGCGGVSAQQLDQTQLRAWLTQCSGCDFSHANLHGMDLRNIQALGMDFSGANFSGADLSGARFSGADFSHANLSGARLHGTHFSGCDFNKTDLRGVDLSDASLSGSDLSSAIMR